MLAGTLEEPKVSTFMQYVAFKADFVAKVSCSWSVHELHKVSSVCVGTG